MRETIAEAVYNAVQQVPVVTEEDRAKFEEIYGGPVPENDGMYGEDVYYGHGEVGDFGGLETVEATLGHEYDGPNDDLAALITKELLVEGDVSQKDGRKVYKVVSEALESYPKTRVNGREQNYFVGGPEEFAKDLAPKIEVALEGKGLLGKIARLVGLGR